MSELNKRALQYASVIGDELVASVLRDLVAESERLQQEHRRLANQWADRIEKQLPRAAAEAECARLHGALEDLLAETLEAFSYLDSLAPSNDRLKDQPAIKAARQALAAARDGGGS